MSNSSRIKLEGRRRPMNRIAEEVVDSPVDGKSNKQQSSSSLRHRLASPINKENETIPRMWKEEEATRKLYTDQNDELSYFSVQEEAVELVMTTNDDDDQQDEDADDVPRTTTAKSQSVRIFQQTKDVDEQQKEVSATTTTSKPSASLPPRGDTKSATPLFSPRPMIARKQGNHALYPAPTYLHEVCHAAKSPKSFEKVLDKEDSLLPTACARKDDEGKIPLHIISENKALAESVFLMEDHDSSLNNNDGDAVIRFVLQLLQNHPIGITWKDEDSYIPFERALVEWVRSVHDSSTGLISADPRKRWSNRTMSTQQTSTLQSMLWQSRASLSAFAWAKGGSSPFPNSPRSVNDGDDEEEADVEEGVADKSSLARAAAAKNAQKRARRYFPKNVRLNAQAMFSIKMLSLILDQLHDHVLSRSFKRRAMMKRKEDDDDEVAIVNSDSFDVAMDDLKSYCAADKSEEIADAVVTVFASMPNLIKTVLLLEDDAERDWVLSTSLFRAIMLNKSSIGPWLTFMLQSSKKNVSGRALAYLSLVSEAVESRECLQQRSKSRSNSTPPKRASDELEEEVSKLEGFVPSLLSLDDWDVEQASTTLVVRRVLDRMISRPFAVTVVFFDALFLALLIVSFRAAVGAFLTGRSPDTVLKWIYLANAGIFYFIIRELGKGITILERTRRARVYLWSFWNITDILSTVFALCSSVAIRVSFGDNHADFAHINPLRALLAVTTGFLWLRVLSLLKSINMQLATFVLAILQITRDILWFMIILITTVVAFAQMFFTLLVPATCATKEETDAFVCKPAEYYLKTYTILLGDFGTFERESFQAWFSVFLAVFFSFMVVVVLLNVLIAIVSDSYEKCLLRSQSLFGRARVMLVAELVSFQNLLRKSDAKPDGRAFSKVYSKWWAEHTWDHGWSRGSAIFFALSGLVVVAWVVGETAGYFSGARHGNFLFSIGSIVLNVIVYAAIITFLSTGATAESMDDSGNSPRRSRCATCILQFYESFVQKAMLRLLGSTQDAATFFKKNAEDDWKGRVHYMQKEMARTAEESNALVAEQTAAVEKHLGNTEAKLRSEMGEMEKRILAVLKQSEERNVEMQRQTLNRLLDELSAVQATAVEERSRCSSSVQAGIKKFSH